MAMSTCLRDKNNPNVIETACRTMDLMQERTQEMGGGPPPLTRHLQSTNLLKIRRPQGHTTTTMSQAVLTHPPPSIKTPPTTLKMERQTQYDNAVIPQADALHLAGVAAGKDISCDVFRTRRVEKVVARLKTIESPPEGLLIEKKSNIWIQISRTPGARTPASQGQSA
ncbi:hypothetical protein Z517_09334 [Fonsecaea pedrosoi CBS 271.37]|uniref:Uncharacterized protein n=1 Tax=Fonsecaea pedrosoi CBS 271.37 TaxID=1442368 RepID=A0A0D2GE14_9EURO|nr:uncharacterized protein Z517_09334 [Fonsecaea pedrosoi CBS 271.37]KIW76890.1 hypothetical protein Z517_09334 [Fonsecaea pedrosoi CBS 271.37]